MSGNNSYIKMGNNNRIAHVLFNEPLIPELMHEDDYRNKPY